MKVILENEIFEKYADRWQVPTDPTLLSFVAHITGRPKDEVINIVEKIVEEREKKKFSITFCKQSFHTIEVEAKNEDEALAKAEEEELLFCWDRYSIENLTDGTKTYKKNRTASYCAGGAKTKREKKSFAHNF